MSNLILLFGYKNKRERETVRKQGMPSVSRPELDVAVLEKH